MTKHSEKDWDDMREDLRKSILLLDCALPYFERQAKAEHRRYLREGGGLLRPVSCKQRLEVVKALIERVGPEVGYDPGY